MSVRVAIVPPVVITTSHRGGGNVLLIRLWEALLTAPDSLTPQAAKPRGRRANTVRRR